MKPLQTVKLILLLFLAGALVFGISWIYARINQAMVLRQIVERLSSDSRVAEVLVTKSEWNEETEQFATTIKFLEYDTEGKPLQPKYFTFQGNIIQFQALVIRFEDRFVEAGDRLRGKSAYLFMKAFTLENGKSEVFDITKTDTVPDGYRVTQPASEFEKNLWKDFWKYALDPDARNRAGIKNAQIEAPGSLFLPGTIYTLRIEHDGGLRIDTQRIPEILKGEKL